VHQVGSIYKTQYAYILVCNNYSKPLEYVRFTDDLEWRSKFIAYDWRRMC